MKKYILPIIFIAASSVSCVNEDLMSPTSDGNELKLTAQVDVLTRATTTAFEINDPIGIYAMAWSDESTSKQVPLTSPYYASNSAFKWNGEGFTNQKNPIYWPEKERKLDLYAYYPYSETGIDLNNKLNISVQTDQSKDNNHTLSDIMTARLLGNERTKDALVLPFKHVMSKVKLILIAGTGYNETELSTLRTTLMQVNTTAKLDLGKANTDNNFITEVATAKDIIATPNHEVILIPQTKVSGEVLFTLNKADGTPLVAYKAENGKNTFESGKQYNFSVKINRVGINTTAEIIDWEVVTFTETSVNQKIELTANIGGTAGDKVESFAENDAIGIFQKNNEALSVVNSSFVWQAGKFTGNNLYWPNNGTTMTLYGYYPYTAGLTSTSLAAKVNTDQQTRTTHAESDVKTAILTTDKSTSGNVVLSFRHSFSKIVVNLVKGNGFTNEEIAGMKVTLPQMKTTAAIDLTKSPGDNNYILNVSEDKDILPFENNATKSAIVVPQTKTIGTTLFSIKTAGGVLMTNYQAENGKNVFESGKQYVCSIKLNRANAHITADIINWEVIDNFITGDEYQAIEISNNNGSLNNENVSFSNGETIGLFAAQWENHEEGTPTPYITNHKFTWENTGFTGEAIYWPTADRKLNLYAYAPYHEGIVMTGTSLPISINQSSAIPDWLIGFKQGVDRTSGKVIFNFRHILSKVNITLTYGTGYEDDPITGPYIKLNNTLTNANVDITTGNLNFPEGAEKKPLLLEKKNDNPLTFTGIIIPQEVVQGTNLMTIYDAENKLAATLTLTSDRTFESGKEYNIAITLKKKGIIITADIKKWETVNGWTGNADQDWEQTTN